jgi:hypothetical protein
VAALSLGGRLRGPPKPRGVVAKHAGLWSRRQRFESARGYSTEVCTFSPRMPPCPFDHRDLGKLNQAFASKLTAFQLPSPKRERETTISPLFSRSVRSPRPTSIGPGEALTELARHDRRASVTASTSPRFHARDPRAAASGRLGGEEVSPAGAPSGPAPVLVLCSTCRQPIRRNETLRISFCPIHGLSGPFTFVPLSQRRYRRA